MIASDVPPRDPAHGRCGCSACCLADNVKHAPMPDWPIDVAGGRLLCTATRPMPHDALGRWSHESVRSDGSDSDSYDGYICNACGESWETEVSQ